ncbi:hypothetical protein G6O67_002574 [Ophiocordyceps sinensis]|uniref:Uncharacterized protein n=1 Tax=Ophiocordyceps sinensis TaxID=72228 RepID=A0A8H4PUF5_9HYPO|nr:hypothetical protein G6O67_002574 [Ophiocordyceps sinensis]
MNEDNGRWAANDSTSSQRVKIAVDFWVHPLGLSPSSNIKLLRLRSTRNRDTSYRSPTQVSTQTQQTMLNPNPHLALCLFGPPGFRLSLVTGHESPPRAVSLLPR